MAQRSDRVAPRRGSKGPADEATLAAFKRSVISGRPPVYATPEAFAEAVIRYFETTPRQNWNLANISIALGFKNKSALHDTDQRGPEFEHISRTARLMIEDKYLGALDGAPVGAIFALKTGFEGYEQLDEAAASAPVINIYRDRLGPDDPGAAQANG